MRLPYIPAVAAAALAVAAPSFAATTVTATLPDVFYTNFGYDFFPLGEFGAFEFDLPADATITRITIGGRYGLADPVREALFDLGGNILYVASSPFGSAAFGIQLREGFPGLTLCFFYEPCSFPPIDDIQMLRPFEKDIPEWAFPQFQDGRFELVVGMDTFSLPGGYGQSVNWTAPTLKVTYTLPGDGSTPPTIPEPATWALLVGGFGLVGAALRRRRPMAVLA